MNRLCVRYLGPIFEHEQQILQQIFSSVLLVEDGRYDRVSTSSANYESSDVISPALYSELLGYPVSALPLISFHRVDMNSHSS